jgi:hypothetical protein
MSTLRFCGVLAASLAVPAARAAVYSGNPHLDFSIQDSAESLTGGVAELERIEIHHCGGGRTRHDINQTIDPIDGYDIDIDPGSHCGVSIVWGGPVELTGAGFGLEYNPVVTYVALSGAVQSADFTPVTVVSGSYTGTPVVTVSIQ